MTTATSTLAAPLSEQAFTKLRHAVLAGALEPGAKLKIDQLQGSFGFSSSPLREALNRLSQEGLVRSDERRGFRVALISCEDLADITHMRLLVDVAALREAIEHGDDAWEAAIVAAAHRLSRVESQLVNGPKVLNETWSRLHRDYHLALLAACPSQRQRALCASFFDQAERYRRYSALNRAANHNKSKEHRRLTDAVLQRNADTACVLLAEHIRSTQVNVEAALQRFETSQH